MTTQTIEVDQFLPHPPATVWRALVEPDLHSRWLQPADIRAEVGHRFSYDMGQWGTTECVVFAVEPESLLSYSWANPPLDTVVTFRLVPEGSGTRLLLTHGPFDDDDPQQGFAFGAMGTGWVEIAERLVGLLGERPA